MYTGDASVLINQIMTPIQSGSDTSEALAISDAFEAVTNGMHNPDAMARLAEVPDTEEFLPWKIMIKAIGFFYARDYTAMEAELALIPESSPVARLRPIILHISGRAVLDRPLTFREENLARKVTEDSRFLTSTIIQLKESLDYCEESFIETSSLFVREIKRVNPEVSQRIALWSFSECLRRGFNEEPLAENLIMLYGDAEGLRLIGLALLEEDPATAFICFIKSLVRRLGDRTVSREETATFLRLLTAISCHIPDDNEIISDTNELMQMLDSELRLFFPDGTGRPDHCVSSDWLARVADMLEAPEVCSYCRPPAPAQTPAKRHSAVQLELF